MTVSERGQFRTPAAKIPITAFSTGTLDEDSLEKRKLPESGPGRPS
jgi:hypothetical protein